LVAGAALSAAPALVHAKPDFSLKSLRTQYHLPAAILAHQTAGGKSHILVDGVRIFGKPDKVQKTDCWHIGSLTKSMTAMLAAMMVDKAALRWDMQLGDVMAQIAPNMNEAYKSVTLEQILHHRSGLPANLDMAVFGAFRIDKRSLPIQRTDFGAQALSLPAVGPAGATFSYSNLGYVIVAALLETLSGKSWEEMITAQVFKPLGLKSAGFGAPGSVQNTPAPWGHRRDGANMAPVPVAPTIFADNPSVMAPAGGVHISADDMLAYLQAHANQAPMISAAGWAKLHTPPEGARYAMGWVVEANGNRWHNGSNTLWYAQATFNAARKATGFFATNDGYLPEATQAAKAAIASIGLGNT
jgi:CubicO group peptidase (beta-lactamase class C family)